MRRGRPREDFFIRDNQALGVQVAAAGTTGFVVRKSTEVSTIPHSRNRPQPANSGIGCVILEPLVVGFRFKAAPETENQGRLVVERTPKAIVTPDNVVTCFAFFCPIIPHDRGVSARARTSARRSPASSGSWTIGRNGRTCRARSEARVRCTGSFGDGCGWEPLKSCWQPWDRSSKSGRNASSMGVPLMAPFRRRKVPPP